MLDEGARRLGLGQSDCHVVSVNGTSRARAAAWSRNWLADSALSRAVSQPICASHEPVIAEVPSSELARLRPGQRVRVARQAPGSAAAPARPAAPASADEIEQRLLTLKRLRERNLISEEEYQQKRREILQAL